MKISQLIALSLAAAAPITAKATPVEMREDCVEIAKNTLAAAAGADQLDDSARQGISVTHVRILGEQENGAGGEDYTYGARLQGQRFSGHVVVTATRGGCFVQKIELSGN